VVGIQLYVIPVGALVGAPVGVPVGVPVGILVGSRTPTYQDHIPLPTQANPQRQKTLRYQV
jgi:hypothetical protein